MKKAVVVGGSNGIGLAVTRKLISEGYFVSVFDMRAPDDSFLQSNASSYSFEKCNLLYFDADQCFKKLAEDDSVEVLMITAGFGRVADFEYLHTAEIANMIQVNTIAAIQIIRCFYNRIKSKESFYCGVMGSIAGLCSSPMFSVYAASKAGICRFVESVNIELEAAGVKNRILNVAPGSVKGTRFNGGENDMNAVSALADEIISHMKNSDELYIPDYENVYKGVLERYHSDAHAFGLQSYSYKQSSGRVFNENCVCIGYLSGTFDLFHVGHLNLIKRAKEQCDYLIVGVHPDASHKNKVTFIPFDERKTIVGSVRYVDKVVDSCREDSEAWERWHFNKLFVGSDYKGTERFKRYEEFFKNKGVEIVYFPYTQGTSSTQIRKAIVSVDAPEKK